MNVKTSITPEITVGDQPSADDLRALKDEGYLGVINLRNEGEPEQPMSPSQEEELVKQLGLNYLHYGVGSAPLTEEGVAAVCRFLDEHAGNKTLVHCRKGGRAAALVLLHQAKTEGWAPEEAVAKGAAVGLSVDGGLKTLVENYLREHNPRTG